MNCTYCGSENSDLNKFCNGCGQELTKGDETYKLDVSETSYQATQSFDANLKRKSYDLLGDSFPSGNDSNKLVQVCGWNWGAFVFSWLWAAGNGMLDIALVSFLAILIIPLGFLVVPVLLGLKGNELLWKKVSYNSVEELKEKQRKWRLAAIIMFMFFMLSFAAMIFFSATTR
ncbi:MAG: hypothetical protein ACLFQV_00660 [Vulcanimicrobiota bacterium]